MIRVIIEQIEEQTIVSQQYQQVADTGNELDGGAQYAYVPLEKVETKTTRLYEQTIDSINLPEVVTFINKQ